MNNDNGNAKVKIYMHSSVYLDAIKYNAGSSTMPKIYNRMRTVQRIVGDLKYLFISLFFLLLNSEQKQFSYFLPILLF